MKDKQDKLLSYCFPFISLPMIHLLPCFPMQSRSIKPVEEYIVEKMVQGVAKLLTTRTVCFFVSGLVA